MQSIVRLCECARLSQALRERSAQDVVRHGPSFHSMKTWDKLSLPCTDFNMYFVYPYATNRTLISHKAAAGPLPLSCIACALPPGMGSTRTCIHF